jgi:hypothetical protein
MNHSQKAAIVLGSQPPIVGISWLEPEDDWDSGYMVIYSDVADLEDDALERELEDSAGLICMHCLVNEYPEAGRGLDLARRHGGAELDGETWVAADHL